MPPQNLTFGQSFGLGAVSPVLQSAGSIIATHMQNKANKELAEYSFDQQRKMIQEQNEYNSPAAQMARYKEAGLNPNLMFGGIDSGQQSGIAKYEAPTMQRPDIPQVDLLSSMQLMLQARKNEAEIRNIDAQTQRYKEETQGIIMRNAWESFISGKPVQGWDFTGSKKDRLYDLSLQSQSILNTMHQVQTDLSRLNVQERDFFVHKLLPLTLQLKNLEIQGATYDNMMKAIDSTLWHDKRIAEMSSSPFRIVGRLADEIIPKESPAGRAVKTMVKESFEPFGMWKEGWKKVRKKFGW